jgi:hypothetical protein
MVGRPRQRARHYWQRGHCRCERRMSSANKVLSRGENPLGMFVKDNVLRTHQRLNPQRCRRRMRIEQQDLPENGPVISEATSLG